MNVKQIIEKYLTENGYDGLVYVDFSGENACGCNIETLCLCDSWACDCQPGYTHSDDDDTTIYLEKEEK